MDGETHDEVMIPQKVESLCGHLRRKSTGIMAAPNLQPPILSRYLRASMGSCHDFCKYGRKHNSEVRTNYLRSRRKATTSGDRHNRDKTSAQLEGNEKLLANVDESPKSVIVKRDDSWSTQDGDVIVNKAGISGACYDHDENSASLERNEKSLVNVDDFPESIIVKKDESLSTQDGDAVVKKAADSGNQYDKDKTSDESLSTQDGDVGVKKAADSGNQYDQDKTSDESLSTQDGDVGAKKAADSGNQYDKDKTSDEPLSTQDGDVVVKKAADSGNQYDKDKTSDESLSTQDGDVVVKKAADSGNQYDKDKTSPSLEGKEKSLVNVDESSKSVIVKTDDSLSTPNRDVSFQQPEDPDVTRDFAADLKKKSAHPSSSTHPKEGKSDEVHDKTEGVLSLAAPQSSSSRNNQKIRGTKATGVSVNKKEKILPSTASIAPERSGRRASNKETRNYKHAKSASTQKNCSISKAEPKLSDCKDKTKKTSDFAAADVGNKMAGTAENSLHTLDESPEAEKERRSKGEITPQLPPSSGKKKSRRSVNAHGSAKLPPSSDKKNTRRIGRRVNQSPSFSSVSSSSSLRSTPSLLTSKSTIVDTPSEHEAAEKGNPVARSNTNRPKRVGTGSSEDKNCQPQTLPFRRGKVVEPGLENGPPRRLRFRRPRLLGEYQIGKGDAARKSFRRKDIDSLEFKSNIKSENITLKHRHVEKRDNARSLFNNVIEETASKLAETRKSKVKALVGAFETVISLQDTKPKATVTAC